MMDGSMMQPRGDPAPEEWDARREGYRMFGDKLWDQAKDQNEQDMDEFTHHGKHHGKDHGKHHGKHHGKFHGKHHCHFCPVMAVVYLVLALHLVFLKQFCKSLQNH